MTQDTDAGHAYSALAPFTYRIGEILAAVKVGQVDAAEAFVLLAGIIMERDAVRDDLRANGYLDAAR